MSEANRTGPQNRQGREKGREKGREGRGEEREKRGNQSKIAEIKVLRLVKDLLLIRVKLYAEF